MKVFISWSGERSRHVALGLREWLPLVLHYVEPWLSEKDIAAGERWALEVGKRLEDANFGIICLSKANLNAPWVLFEAGALSKFLGESSVCPYLIDLDLQDVPSPLSQFQAKKAERLQTRELVEAINGRANSGIPSSRLGELFEALWPKLEERLSKLPPASSDSIESRSQTDILEELVSVVRSFDQRLRKFESRWAEARSRAPYLFRVRMFEDMGSMKGGAEFEVLANGPSDLVLKLTKYTQLDVDLLGKDWFIEDLETSKRYGRENMDSIFYDLPSAIQITSFPF